MPWRRRAKILEQLQKKHGRPLGSVGILGLLELLVERIYAIARLLLFMSIALAVICVALEIQVQQRNHKIDSFNQRLSAVSNTLGDAIRLGQDPATLKRTQDALDEIKRIENFLCHGTCPPAPQQGGQP